mgnify:CR=1 FL=1
MVIGDAPRTWLSKAIISCSFAVVTLGSPSRSDIAIMSLYVGGAVLKAAPSGNSIQGPSSIGEKSIGTISAAAGEAKRARRGIMRCIIM